MASLLTSSANILPDNIDTSRFYDTNTYLRPYNDEYLTRFQNPDALKSCAKDLFDECLRRRSSHSYSSLYCGDLGPQTYLRLKWCETMIENKRERQSIFEVIKNISLDAMDASKNKRFVVTLLEGKWIGSACMLVAAEYRLGNIKIAKTVAEDVLHKLKHNTRRLPPEECEVLYGRAGAIQAILLLRSELNDSRFGEDLVVELATDILTQGRKEATRFNDREVSRQNHLTPIQLMWKWHGKYYLGAAHGVVGILHTVLQLSDSDLDLIQQNDETFLKTSILDLIASTIDVVIGNFSMESGNFQSSTISERDRLVHWCHGAPGLCLLLIIAAKRLGSNESLLSQRYLQKAITIATNVIYPRGLLKKGVGLCHGIAGNGYVLLQLSQALSELSEESNKEKGLIFRKWAWQYAAFATDHLRELKHIPDRPYSLFEGVGGLVSFLLACHATGTNAMDHPVLFPLYDHYL